MANHHWTHHHFRSTLQGTNISPPKMIFLFPRWDMLIHSLEGSCSFSNHINRANPRFSYKQEHLLTQPKCVAGQDHQKRLLVGDLQMSALPQPWIPRVEPMGNQRGKPSRWPMEVVGKVIVTTYRAWKNLTWLGEMLPPCINFGWSSDHTCLESRWWFQTFFIFTPTWGDRPIWRAYFFRWVGSTTN